jgi:hypothetical protein
VDSVKQICANDDQAACRATFEAFDADSSGTIEQQELEVMLLSFLQMLQVKSEMLQRAKVTRGDGGSLIRGHLSAEKQWKVAKAMASKQFRGREEGQRMEYSDFHAFFMTTIAGRK